MSVIHYSHAPDKPLSHDTAPSASRLNGPSIQPATLRLSVTERCNFRCRYCMPAHRPGQVDAPEQLTLDQLYEQTAWLHEQIPIRKVKLTGGEPLVRQGIVEFVRKLAAMDGVGEVSMTTNGSLLARHATGLKAAGLSRVNISLDSLDEERFRTMSRGGRLHRTLEGVEAALKHGLTPVKINSVLLRSSWREDVPVLLDFAAERRLELRFIELMRTGTEAEWASGEFVSAERVRDWLEQTAELEPVIEPAGSPSRGTRLLWHGHPVKVGWITPMSYPFCDSCNRLRMDAHGTLRRCLMDPATFPLAAIRATFSPEETRRWMELYLAGKQPPENMGSDSPMSAVGG